MSSLNLNKALLCGRLTADVELKQTTSGVSVCSFTLAVTRRFGGRNADGAPAIPPTDFINCIAWRQTAEFIARYFKKGSALCIAGMIQTRSWTDGQGQKRYATEVVAEEASFVDSRSGASGEPASANASSGGASSVPEAVALCTEPYNEDDLPF